MTVLLSIYGTGFSRTVTSSIYDNPAKSKPGIKRMVLLPVWLVTRPDDRISDTKFIKG